MLLRVALGSLRYRAGGVVLTLLAIGLSVFVLLGVEHLRRDVRAGFASTVSGVDLIVGARTSDVSLLLLSVFRIGSASANVSHEAAEAIRARERVAWVVPLSLGDSHRGFRVVGTTGEFFRRYRYARQLPLSFRRGRGFETGVDVVLGAEVADALAYELEDELVLSHGLGAVGFQLHDQQPLTIVGILERTGTPVDNALFVSLDALALLHDEGHHGDTNLPGEDHDRVSSGPQSVTALLVGVASPVASLQVQRWINEYAAEPLLAILPGVALMQLWDIVGGLEATLRVISVLVFVASLFGLNALLMASLRERRREIEILRSVGAPSGFIVGLLLTEVLLIVTLAIALALAGLLLAIALANGLLAERLGLLLSWKVLTPTSLAAIALIYVSATLLSLLPAWQAYRLSRVPGTRGG